MDLGNTFSVDARNACEKLKAYAMEQENEQDTNKVRDDDGQRNSEKDEACSDNELDSMFATLNDE
jgi:hypothetical protein